MLKKILFAILALLGLLVGAVLLRFYVFAPAVAPAEDLQAPRDPASIERGRYLAEHVFACMGCHSEVDEAAPGEPVVPGKLGAGREFPEDPYGAGVMRAPNLTPANLADWTDGEIVRAMREGVDDDDQPIFPMMPYPVYRELLSREDALAIVAYLRSLEPIAHDVGGSSVAFPVSMLVRGMPRPVEAEPTVPPPDGSLGRGRWLLRAASCGDCHHTVDGQRQPVEGMAYAGGIEMPIAGEIVRAPNITSDPATGVGAYTDEALRRAIFEGKGQDGRDLYGMPWTHYAGMRESDKVALLAAVREIPAVVHPVARVAE